MSSDLSVRPIFLIGMILVCLGIVGCSKGDDSVRIEGKAPANVSKMCLMQQLGMFRTVVEAPVDSLGNYTLTYSIKHPEKFILTDGAGNHNVDIFLTSGDHLKVDFEGDKILFSGDQELNNRFLQELKVFQIETGKKHPGNMMDASSQKSAAENMAVATLDYIDQAALKDEVFAGTMKVSALKDKYNSMLFYPEMYKMVFGGQAPVDSSYYDFVSEIDLTSPYWLNVGGVYPFLHMLFQTMETYGYLQTDLMNYLPQRGKKIGNAGLREGYYLYALDLMDFESRLDTLVAGIEKEIMTDKGKQTLADLKIRNQKKMVEFEALLPGKPAFDIKGTDQNGAEHMLGELKGKIVVVDVWNTGCKPCLAEMPFLHKIEKQFEGRDVVFVSYSLDTDVDTWKNFMTARNMTGIQWIDTLGFKSELVKNYALKGIPRFMVFGRQGEIIDVFAPRPSAPRLAQLIEVSLNK